MNEVYPLVPLGELLIKSEEWIDINPTEKYKQVTVKIWGKGVIERNEVSGAEIAATKRLKVRYGQFILSRIDARHGAVVTNDFPVFTLNNQKIVPQFLDWISKTKDFIELCKAASEGTTNRVRLKEDKFLLMKIPLPPLEEQRRIVLRVEELVGKIEEVRSLRQKALEETDVLLAVESTKLLAKTLVKGQLSDVLLEKPRNGWSARCNNMPEGTPILSLGAVTGFSYRQTEFKRTSEPVSIYAHYWLKPGDLLITRSNTPELVGHAAIYNGSPYPCIYPDLMMRLETDESKTDKQFVHHWLACTLVRNYIKGKAKGTSPTMKKISQDVVMNIPFPSDLSIPEQRRIVAYLDELQTKVDTMKQHREEAIKELDALLPAILDKAFKGEL
ncbi:restriction endonuclease S subunit [Cylindrospermum stagnale PCC 7417]|uniref:Restriction endonuclease S subunit n=1 Tax=Cylindrospermum stagnale PCC 7417 TaxID=56107 RepID=K9X4Z5_9NOST|nr:restriction endonuclease subunit S [Cylindrospermum stagnale]AFZ27111.1 restriction endonuclease S subunit [Cylindrospermum stagnale PCC 7417]